MGCPKIFWVKGTKLQRPSPPIGGVKPSFTSYRQSYIREPEEININKDKRPRELSNRQRRKKQATKKTEKSTNCQKVRKKGKIVGTEKRDKVCIGEKQLTKNLCSVPSEKIKKMHEKLRFAIL